VAGATVERLQLIAARAAKMDKCGIGIIGENLQPDIGLASSRNTIDSKRQRAEGNGLRPAMQRDLDGDVLAGPDHRASPSGFACFARGARPGSTTARRFSQRICGGRTA
jgi:hypothetical protein